MDGSKLLVDKKNASGGESPAQSAWKVEMNFYLMSLFFSLNHGTVTALIALATSKLGGHTGNLSSGVLYAAYTLSAMFLAAPIVHISGLKGGIVLGLFMYCFYVVAFMLARFDSIEIPAVCIGALLGGCAAGFLWTAQGGFFSSTCKTLARLSGKEEGDITTKLGGKFAFIYLSGEVTMKVLSTVIDSIKGADGYLNAVFCTVALGSTIGMLFVNDCEDHQAEKPDDISSTSAPTASTKQPKPPLTRKMFISKAGAASKLLFTDPKMIFLYPAQIVFGFMGVYLNGYANTNVVKDVLGGGNDKYVGVLTAIVAAVAAVSSGVLGLVGKKIKLPLMVLGGAVWMVEAFIFMMPNERLGVWGYCILLYTLHGIGRSVWESTNKSVFADFFGSNAPAAFANVIFSNGLSGALGFLSNSFAPLSKHAQLWVCIVTAGLSILGAICAFSIARRDTTKQQGGMLA